jgi:phytoene dehydrogenase-like protein
MAGSNYDAIVVGSGPNGLAAAIAVAEKGGSVLLLEAASEIGGGVRTAELMRPGVKHDVCSSVYPLAIASPYLSRLPLEKHGLSWVQPKAAVAHPLDDGTAVLLKTSLEETAEGLGEDAGRYRALLSSFIDKAPQLFEEILQPLQHLPKHPLLMARFGLKALQSAHDLAHRSFKGPRARALFAGVAGHSILPLSWKGSAAVALPLMIAGHRQGWPLVRGGAGELSRALGSYLKSLGGEIRTGVRVGSLGELPESKSVFLDVTPAQFVVMAGDRLSESQKRGYLSFRPGPGVFKMDFVLSGPIPWTARDCALAATVHLGASLEEIEESELAAFSNQASPRPYVLLVQASLFDPTRAPSGSGTHTAWAYCHVPNGSREDMSSAIEAQIERFAPGFCKRVIDKRVTTPANLEAYNPNYIGGDIGGGALDLRQILFRPRPAINPYATPLKGVYLCSASTPPGPGVHGMCGYWAVLAANIG